MPRGHTLDVVLEAHQFFPITQALIVEQRTNRPRWKRLALHIASAAALALAAVVWGRQLDASQLWLTLTRARVFPLAAAATGAFVCIAWKAGFWRLALSPLRVIPLRELFRFGVAAEVGSILAPGRAGEALRVWILRRRYGLPLSALLTAAGLEKLADVSTLVLLAAPMAWLVPALPTAVRPWLLGFSAVPIAAALGIVFLRGHSRLRELPALAGLRLFDTPRPLLLALGCVVIAWLFDLACAQLVLSAVGTDATIARAILVLLLTNLAIIVPLMPGNVGAHELASAFALKLMGVDAETATAFALLFHAVRTIPVLILGFPATRRLVVSLGDESASQGATLSSQAP